MCEIGGNLRFYSKNLGDLHKVVWVVKGRLLQMGSS